MVLVQNFKFSHDHDICYGLKRIMQCTQTLLNYRHNSYSELAITIKSSCFPCSQVPSWQRIFRIVLSPKHSYTTLMLKPLKPRLDTLHILALILLLKSSRNNVKDWRNLELVFLEHILANKRHMPSSGHALTNCWFWLCAQKWLILMPLRGQSQHCFET